MKIEKQVVLRAPLERVWRAISDAEEFGRWFGVRFDGPFVAGTSVTAAISPTTVDGEVAERQEPHAGVRSTWQIVTVEPPRRFAYRWHPFAVDPGVDYDQEPTTLVEFTLSEQARRRAADHHRVRFRGDPAGAPRSGVRGQRRGLGDPDHAGAQVHRGRPGMSARVAVDAPLFDALGDPNRLRIIVRLCDRGPSSTSQVTSVIPVTRQAASKHLQLLESVGLVTSSRRGRERVWTVQTQPLASASDYLSQLSRRWDAAVDRLRAFVED